VRGPPYPWHGGLDLAKLTFLSTVFQHISGSGLCELEFLGNAYFRQLISR
jgi:hypothetical protein